MELKPCPFCGGWAKLTRMEETHVSHESYFVVCNGCPAQTSAWGRWLKDEAIEIWNRRPSED